MAKSQFDRSTITLKHFGRKTGKPYNVTIWFVVMDGKVWVGSLSHDRSWVKNVRATGRAELDFGSEQRPVKCRYAGDARDVQRFADAVKAKYPITSRILGVFFRGNRCAFETDLAAA